MRAPLPAGTLTLFGLGFALLPAPDAPAPAGLSPPGLERLSRPWGAVAPGPGRAVAQRADLDLASVSLAQPAAERGRRLFRPFFQTGASERLGAASGLTSTARYDEAAGAERVRRAFAGGIDLSEGERRDVAAFLGVMHAAFNLNLAEQRIRAARELERSSGSQERPRANRMLELASAELDHAREALGERDLHPRARADAAVAAGLGRLARKTRSTSLRALLSLAADRCARRARGALGTGLFFELGERGLAL